MDDLEEIRKRLDIEVFCMEDSEYLYAELIKTREKLTDLEFSLLKAADLLETDIPPHVLVEVVENNIIPFPQKRSIEAWV